ncbi:uncharacterized protein (DUF2147 family) [Ensifer sp. 4252]
MKRIFTTAAALTLATGIAHAEDPIVGNWKTELGDTAAIASCGGGYCITLNPASMRASRSAPSTARTAAIPER